MAQALAAEGVEALEAQVQILHLPIMVVLAETEEIFHYFWGKIQIQQLLVAEEEVGVQVLVVLAELEEEELEPPQLVAMEPQTLVGVAVVVIQPLTAAAVQESSISVEE
jgi:hypothetical protein